MCFCSSVPATLQTRKKTLSIEKRATSKPAEIPDSTTSITAEHTFSAVRLKEDIFFSNERGNIHAAKEVLSYTYVALAREV